MGNGQSSSLHNAAGKNQISQVRSLLTERNMDPNMRDEVRACRLLSAAQFS